jgi:hypothetical protein
MTCVDVHGNACTKKKSQHLDTPPWLHWFELELFLYYSGKFGYQLNRSGPPTDQCNESFHLLSVLYHKIEIPTSVDENTTNTERKSYTRFSWNPRSPVFVSLARDLASLARSTHETNRLRCHALHKVVSHCSFATILSHCAITRTFRIWQMWFGYCRRSFYG